MLSLMLHAINQYNRTGDHLSRPWFLRCLAGLFVLSQAVLTSAAQNLPLNPDLLTKEWTAQWLTHPTAPERDYGVYHFRRSFDLPGKPASFIVHVTADNRYRLFVNGQAIGFGPARGDRMHWRYETYDLARWLRAGPNVLAATVWNMGSDAPVAQQSLQTGFLVQGNTVQEAIVNTVAPHWKVLQNPAYQPLRVTPDLVLNQYYAAGACERLSAAQYPWGWEMPEFDDRTWVAARAGRTGKPAYYRYGHGEGDGNLIPRNIPLMEEKLERLPKLVRAAGVPADDGFLQGTRSLIVPANTQASVLVDQTYLTTAYPELVVSGGSGRHGVDTLR